MTQGLPLHGGSDHKNNNERVYEDYEGQKAVISAVSSQYLFVVALFKTVHSFVPCESNYRSVSYVNQAEFKGRKWCFFICQYSRVCYSLLWMKGHAIALVS